jgi:hypothetical protein
LILGFLSNHLQTPANSEEETLQLLSYAPDRLGHATFLNEESKTVVRRSKTCIEICLSSNLLSVYLADLQLLSDRAHPQLQNSLKARRSPHSVLPAARSPHRHLRAPCSVHCLSPRLLMIRSRRTIPSRSERLCSENTRYFWRRSLWAWDSAKGRCGGSLKWVWRLGFGEKYGSWASQNTRSYDLTTSPTLSPDIW